MRWAQRTIVSRIFGHARLGRRMTSGLSMVLDISLLCTHYFFENPTTAAQCTSKQGLLSVQVESYQRQRSKGWLSVFVRILLYHEALHIRPWIYGVAMCWVGSWDSVICFILCCTSYWLQNYDGSFRSRKRHSQCLPIISNSNRRLLPRGCKT